MANRRDGGRVIIGVEGNDNTLNPVGFSDVDLPAWNYDDVADQIARYADPSVSFELEVKEYNGGIYIVLEVAEFTDIPVLCKRAYDNVLRNGACYVRTRRKPETTEIPTQADMRDLLDLAIEKGVRRSLEWAQRVGLFIPQAISPPATDQERFDEQLGEI
jgi:predicted HTH transcriptional regulator